MFRRHLLLSTLFLCAMASHAQPGEINRTDAQGRKQGIWAKAWDNGKLRYQGQFKDDKPTGEFKHYDEEGKVTTIQVYDEDGRVSRARHFHPDGSLMAQGRYVGQQKDSTWNYYDDDGQLRRVENFQNGQLDGEVRVYFHTGHLAEKDLFEKGKKQGPSKSWYPTGELRSELEFVEGLPQGRMIIYYPNGRKEFEGPLKNGERHGTWFQFNGDGSVHRRLSYLNGELKEEVRENGTFTEYYPDEKPRSEITYRKGKKEGPFVEYHDTGEWVIVPRPADPVTGERADVMRELKGQTKKIEGRYKNDLLDGEVREYDERGRLLKVTTYEAGVVKGEQVKR